jgi:hypothetical protein
MNRQLVENLAHTIRSLSTEERELLLAEVQRDKTDDEIRGKLHAYEQQYGMSSQEFYHQFMAGELGDAMDYIEWAGFYELLS